MKNYISTLDLFEGALIWKQKNYRVLLPQRQFLKLLLANLVSRLGDSLDVIAYTWIMYEVTGSESSMALIMGLNYVPTVLLQPFAGALVDRMKKKGLMVLTDVARFVIVAVFVTLYANGALTPLLIAVLTLCTSTVEALRVPAGGFYASPAYSRALYHRKGCKLFPVASKPAHRLHACGGTDRVDRSGRGPLD